MNLLCFWPFKVDPPNEPFSAILPDKPLHKMSKNGHFWLSWKSYYFFNINCVLKPFFSKKESKIVVELIQSNQEIISLEFAMFLTI